MKKTKKVHHNSKHVSFVAFVAIVVSLLGVPILGPFALILGLILLTMGLLEFKEQSMGDKILLVLTLVMGIIAVNVVF